MSLYNEREKLWSGPAASSSHDSTTSVGQALLKAMKKNPRNIAQISANNGIQYNYDELYLLSVRAAQNLQKLNFQKGDIFGIVSQNSHELAPIAVALMSIGHPFNSLDPSFTETEISHIFNITKPKLVFCDLKSYDAVTKSLANLGNDAPIYTFEGCTGKSIAVETLFGETGDEANFVPPGVDGKNDIAVILCSSGTSGPPKAISLNHAIILNQMPKVFEIPEITAESVGLGFSSIYWVSAVSMLVVGILKTATRIITTDTYSSERILQLIERYKVTFIISATHQLLMTLKDPAISDTNLASLNFWLTGGSKVPLDACVEISKYVPNLRISAAYGLTEIGGINTLNYPFVERGCAGRLSSGSHYKIAGENGERLGVGKSGEICVKIETDFSGYYGNKAATDALYDSDGFIQTGDIGHFDADGLLHVTDRKKDFLKYCNYMISPSEIEDFLIASPDVASVCVVGITDRIGGDLPAAVIVRKEKSKITEEDINEMVERKFADSRKLRGGVYFVESLPVTGSGKVLRREVKLFATERYKTSDRCSLELNANCISQSSSSKNNNIAVNV